MQLLGAFTFFVGWFIVGEKQMVFLAEQFYLMLGWTITIILISVILARMINEYFWKNSQNTNHALLFFKNKEGSQ